MTASPRKRWLRISGKNPGRRTFLVRCAGRNRYAACCHDPSIWISFRHTRRGHCAESCCKPLAHRAIGRQERRLFDIHTDLGCCRDRASGASDRATEWAMNIHASDHCRAGRGRRFSTLATGLTSGVEGHGGNRADGKLPHAERNVALERAWDGAGLVWNDEDHTFHECSLVGCAARPCTATRFVPRDEPGGLSIGPAIACCDHSSAWIQMQRLHLSRPLYLIETERIRHRLDCPGGSSPFCPPELPKLARCRGTDHRLARENRHSKVGLARRSHGAPSLPGTRIRLAGRCSQQNGQPAGAIARSRCFRDLGDRSHRGTARRIHQNADRRTRFLDRNPCSRGICRRSISVAGSR